MPQGTNDSPSPFTSSSISIGLDRSPGSIAGNPKGIAPSLAALLPAAPVGKAGLLRSWLAVPAVEMAEALPCIDLGMAGTEKRMGEKEGFASSKTCRAWRPSKGRWQEEIKQLIRLKIIMYHF